MAAAFEISEQCNRVYAHNFGDAPRTQSIEHVDAALLDSLGADTWLMSPPCQPYTSQGLQKDDADPRARALLHLARVLPQMRHPPGAILLENVNNFQRSQSHRIWLAALTAAGFAAREFLLTPAQLGVPNERLRYYCLARRDPAARWGADAAPTLLGHIPGAAGMHERDPGEESRVRCGPQPSALGPIPRAARARPLAGAC